MAIVAMRYMWSAIDSTLRYEINKASAFAKGAYVWIASGRFKLRHLREENGVPPIDAEPLPSFTFCAFELPQ